MAGHYVGTNLEAYYGDYWTSWEYSYTDAYFLRFNYNSTYAIMNTVGKSRGQSVRGVINK